MAIGIENYPNLDTTDPTNYPNGRIKDDPAGIVGTPVEEKTWGDYTQFFAKLLRMAGITPTNTPENETNGFQYITALQTIFQPAFSSSGIVFTNSGTNVWGNKGTPYNNVGYCVVGNIVFLCGVAHNSALSGGTTANILTLPSFCRPAKTVVVSAYNSDPAIDKFIQLTINTSGQITTSVTAESDVYLDGISFRLA